MAYETSIGSNQLLYEITLPASPALVVSLLSTSDLAELNTWEIDYRSNKPLKNIEVLDGFISSDDDFEIRHKIGGVAESFTGPAVAYFPYLDWHKKTYVSGTGTALVKFIIGFTKRSNF